MAMLITSIEYIKNQSTPEGFLLFCKENGVNPESYTEPEHGVCVDKMDMYRYGATAAAQNLTSSVRSMLSA